MNIEDIREGTPEYVALLSDMIGILNSVQDASLQQLNESQQFKRNDNLKKVIGALEFLKSQSLSLNENQMKTNENKNSFGVGAIRDFFNLFK